MSDFTAYPANPAPADVPVCPRHPDRESHVRCQRCGRPVCPECQRPAAVGVQCVDCVREGAKTVRTGRTVFGGAATGRPVVTYALIGICAVVYAAELLSPDVFQALAFSPSTGAQEPWRALTAAFLHSPQMFLHIVFNMLCLWQIGPYLESLLGRLRFTLLYLVTAVGGSAGFLLLAAAPPAGTLPSIADEVAPQWFTGVVGASGAVFGLFAALLVLNRHLGRSTAGIGVVILINAVFGFIYPGIAWQAHLGGFVTGLACAGVVMALHQQHLRRYAVLGLLGVLAVVIAVMAAKYATVPALYR
jgi:membrane associated rhomboid family serine protease